MTNDFEHFYVLMDSFVSLLEKNISHIFKINYISLFHWVVRILSISWILVPNDKAQFIYFFVVACAFDIISKKLLPNPRSQIFLPLFSSKSFIILALTFRSMKHIELIFVYGVS